MFQGNMTQIRMSGEQEIENCCWARQINTKTPGSNTSIKWQPAMVYVISLLGISDLESIGRKMPNGTGIDASIDGAAKAERHKKGREIEMQ
jgi:hypothetical protein